MKGILQRWKRFNGLNGEFQRVVGEENSPDHPLSVTLENEERKIRSHCGKLRGEGSSAAERGGYLCTVGDV